MSDPASSVLVISSHVVRGSVGARAAFVLERLGYRTWVLPTVILPWHPGHGRAHRLVPPIDDFTALCADLERAPWAKDLAAIVTGYIGSPEQAAPIARLIRTIKAVNPAVTVLVDPVIGDAGGLYVAPTVVEAIRTELLPLADIATPNRFELAHLTGLATETMPEIIKAARERGPAKMLVTSVPAMLRGRIGTALITAGDVIIAENPMVEGAPSGTGDLFAAVFLARLLGGFTDESALTAAASATVEIVGASVRSGSGEMELQSGQDSLVTPRAMVDIRHFALPRKPRKPEVQKKRLAGVDGCKNGWIAAVRNNDGAIEIHLVAKADELTALADLIAIDMPMGLERIARPGGRDAEKVSRKYIGIRRSSMFSMPSRKAIYASDFKDAQEIAISNSIGGISIGRQAFGIFPKVRELDELLQSNQDLKHIFFETHPEVAFTALNNGRPMTHDKKKRDASGRVGIEERRAILIKNGIPKEIVYSTPPRSKLIKPNIDDMIDCLVSLIVAERIFSGTALQFPEYNQQDEHGIRMAIWA